MPTTECEICGSDDCICHVKVCNCARCQQPLTSDASAVGQVLIDGRNTAFIELLAGHYDDRPYCERCLPEEQSPGEVAVRFHNYRTFRQKAKWGSTAC